MAKLDLNALKNGGKSNDKGPESSAGNDPVSAGSGHKPAAGLAFLTNRSKPAPMEAADKPAPPPAEAKAASAGLGGLGFLKNRIGGPSGGSGGGAGATNPVDAVERVRADDSDSGRDAAPAGGIADTGSLELSDLLDSEAGGGSPAKTLTSGKPSRFADEVPAQAPTRELPEDADKSMLQFVESLDTVYKIVHEPDMLGGVIKSIMMELARKPEYRKLIQPKDTHTMIKGMRDSMGMARIKKEETKAKRSGGSRAKKKVEVDDMDALLDSLGDFG